ncbi:MAG: hypothetical protein NZ927_07520 [Candidatus Calescibacterium sp.]|nr:hypothetical protein [Candidatus Calescibacterium sp.]MCX7734743.1 hypothetical protein [bacterium]MDW8087275.1 hypothetical protein [Candidatus Calescibacterium sp.]
MITKEKFSKAKEIILKRHLCLDIPEDDYDVIVTIPVLADENIFETLDSIGKAINPEKIRICVFLLVNEPSNSDDKTKEKNKNIYESLKDKKQISDDIKLVVRYVQNIPSKLAGAGFARRLLMDETICMFERLLRRKKTNDMDLFRHKTIISVDSDCIVSENYFDSLKNIRDFGVFLFSHRFSDVPEIKEAGMFWELFLRYWRNSLRISGYDFSFYPIGSLFAFRTSVYIITGGMNTKKGGEDFYFMQKVTPYFSTDDLPAYVFPKAEPSERTPFGTGMEIRAYIQGKKDRITKTWRFEAFEEIGEIFRNPERGSKNEFFREFLKLNRKYQLQLDHIKSMSKDEQDFIKKFRTWLNPFKVFKILRFSEIVFGKSSIEIEAEKLISKILSNENKDEKNKLVSYPIGKTTENSDITSKLEFLRRYDESNLHRVN